MNQITLILVFQITRVFSTHFRGGSISIRPIEANDHNVTVEFSTYFAWRRDYDSSTFCDDLMIGNKSRFAPNLNIFCDKGCFQQNEIIGNTSIVCTSYSETDNWSLGQNTFNYTLPKNSSVELSFKGNFWIELVSLGTDRHNAHWEIRAKYNTTIRNDTNRLNTSPITLIPPIIRVQIGKKHTIKIPTADLDDDLVKCRWSDSANKECASICHSIKNANLSSNCILEFDATNASIGWYAVAIQIEDFKSSDQLPLSSIPIQFLILVEETKHKICLEQPKIIEPLDTCYVGQLNVPVNKVVIARSDCENITIKEIQVLGPMGALKSKSFKLNDSQNNELWYSNISWTPTKKGVYLICVAAIDSNLLKSNLSCFTILIDVLKPQLIIGTQTPNQLVDSNLKFDYFKIQFGSYSIQKPVFNSAFIRLFSDDNVELDKLNTKEPNVIKINMNEIMFKFNYNFSENKWYYILLDSGIVVGDDNCRPGSEEMKMSSVWRFKFIVKQLFSIESTTKKGDITWLFDSKQCDFLNFITILACFSLFIIMIHTLLFACCFSSFSTNKNIL